MQNIVLKSDNDLKVFLATNYMAQIKNFFGDEKQAMKFLSSVMADVQKNPKLIECEGSTLINSYMTMAQLGLMPSGISGEAYVLPYKKGPVMQAQFQLGYQGIITLFYRAGGTGIRAELIRKNDRFEYVNGQISHTIDILKSNAERGDVVGAYAIANVNGQEIAKAMNLEDIIAFGKNFSKSFSSEYSPWNTKNDPEGWMYKKTVLKQLAKMLPKNETIYKAIEEDNQESRISEVRPMLKSNELQMGNFLKANENNNKEGKKVETENEGVEGSDTDFREENAITY